MSSSVFFKFKSQREPQRVNFDGTGISVFELKREIINISKLGDGTDFDLSIYTEDMSEEYDDDTSIVPRSTTVIARRLPATKPGQGRAARYVSGRMPVNAKNSHRTDHASATSTFQNKPPTTAATRANGVDKAQTEEERIKAMLQMDGEQWEQQRQHMSTASRVPVSGLKQKNTPAPEHPPPPGYVCYRCGQKGHWIQACPTNNDPNFDGKPRIKRITGIPRSFLKTVEDDSSSSNQDGLTDDSRQPASVMVNAEGDRVVAVPDQASWDQYQEKAQASAAQKDVAATGNKELQDRGLECPIDKRLFVDPMKTPCCGTTYCNECIENALINSDLVCPKCSTEGVLLDNLVHDEEMIAKIKEYEEEKKAEKAKEEKVDDSKNSPKPANETKDAQSPTPSAAAESGGTSTSTVKKRPAEEELPNDRKGASPSDMHRSESASKAEANSSKPQVKPPSGSDQDFIQQMNALAQPQNQDSNTNLPFPIPPNFPMGMGMSMPPNMGMPSQMMNPMMMGQWNNMGMPGMGGFPQYNMNGAGMFDPNMNGMFPQQNWQGNMNMNWMQPQPNQQMNGFGPQNHAAMGAGKAPMNQQFSQTNGNDDDNAYMRKPVNPHRHQGRQKKIRPTDYREL